MFKHSFILLSGLSLATSVLAQEASSVAKVDASTSSERLMHAGLTLGAAEILASDADTEMQFGAQLGTRELHPNLDLGMAIRYFGKSAKASYEANSAKVSASSWSFLPNASYVLRTSKMDVLLGAQAGIMSVSSDVELKSGDTKLMHETKGDSRFGVGPRVQFLFAANALLDVTAGIDYLMLVDAKDTFNFEAGLSLKF